MIILLLLATFIDCGSRIDEWFKGGGVWSTAPSSDSTLRYGPEFSYHIPARGAVTVRLKFVEPTVTKPGERVFSIKINGAIVEPALDLIKSDTTSTTYRAADLDGYILIEFKATLRNAVVSSIEVIEDSPIPIPGQGLESVSTPTGSIWHINDAVVPKLVAPPTRPGPCHNGDIAVGSPYLYVCSQSIWHRATLETNW